MSTSTVRGVYFLRLGDHIKIGVSDDVLARVNGLQTASPLPIAVVGVWVGATRADEQALHRRFRHARRKGEWFEAVPELVEEAQRWAEFVPSEERAPRRGGGRPRIGRKSWAINVRVFPDEIEAIQAAFERRGLTVATEIRQFVFERAGLTPRPDPDEPEAPAPPESDGSR